MASLMYEQNKWTKCQRKTYKRRQRNRLFKITPNLYKPWTEYEIWLKAICERIKLKGGGPKTKNTPQKIEELRKFFKIGLRFCR